MGLKVLNGAASKEDAMIRKMPLHQLDRVHRAAPSHSAALPA
jgi:hypothetical protein